MPENNKFLELNKIDVAVRQLETAVKMYFNEDAPVSIHTLTMASYNILRELNTDTPSQWLTTKPNKNIDIKNPPDGSFYYGFKPESRMWVFNKFNEATNFFKHADRDPSGKYKFYPKTTDFLIFEAERELTIEYNVNSFLLYAYHFWFRSHYPNLFNHSEEEIENFNHWRIETKKEFSEDDFSLLRPIWNKELDRRIKDKSYRLK